METLEKKFVLFSPPWKSVKIYFSEKDVLDSDLFNVLSLKTLPNLYIPLRKKLCLINSLFTKVTNVPKEKTFLIYEGYDSIIYFYYKENGIGVIRKKGSGYIEEEFLGNPIHYDFSIGNISNKGLLKEILQKHWEGLKNRTEKIHGDFTHNNILLNDKGKVTFIDSKNVSCNTPILTDFFYFYAYFLIRASKYQPKDKKRIESIKREIDSIYLDIFKSEDISEQIEELKIENFHIKKDEKLFDYWKDKFYKLLVTKPL